MLHLTWFIALSPGNPRYALIGVALGLSGVACLTLIGRQNSPPRRYGCSCRGGVSRLLGADVRAFAVRFTSGYAPNERVRNLETTANYLASRDHDERYVGGWWATVVDLEYLMPTTSNFVPYDEVTLEHSSGRILVRNTTWSTFGPSPAFTEWEERCDDVLLYEPPIPGDTMSLTDVARTFRS